MLRRLVFVSAVVGLAVGCGSSPQESDLAETPESVLRAVAVPGRVQAELFAAGGEGVGYHDTTPDNLGGKYRRRDAVDIEATSDVGGGYDVGWIEAGEWLDYGFNVEQSGSFLFTARLASGASGTKSLRLLVDGAAQPAVSFDDDSGWQVWSDVRLGTVALTAGLHRFRVFFESGGLNFNHVDITLAGSVPSADAEAPRIVIAAPAPGSTVSGSLVVSGTAQDNVGVARVELQVDTGAWAAATGTASWTATVETAPLASGAHVLRARAVDAAGNIETATVEVRVADTRSPSVEITSPGANSSISGSIMVRGTASGDLAVTRVELQVDGGAWTSAAGAANWTVSLDTSGLTNGAHTLGARATDAAGNQGTTSVAVVVANAVAALPDFPGHQPGKIYLGYGVDNANCPAGSTLAEEMVHTGPISLNRFYQTNITSTSTEVSRFESALAAGRLAWISFKPSPYTWAQIASGAADAVLRAKAQAYQGVSGPGLITFHHEPNGDGAATDYVAAWNRILNVWQSAGGTGKITPCPILNGFFLSFPNGNSGYTDAQMAQWMPDSLIRRFKIIGYDGYDVGIYGDEGIPQVRTLRKWRQWLLRRQAVINDGQKRYLALGEVGVFYGSDNAALRSWPTSSEGEFPNGYPGWSTLWSTLVSYGSGDASFVAVNYFNSIANTDFGLDWSLRARRPTTTAADLACDSGNSQPPPQPGVADATRVDRFAESLKSPTTAWVADWNR